MRIIVCVLLALCALSTVSGQDKNMEAPNYIINLDQDPALRWAHVVPDFVDSYGPILAWLDKLYPPELQKYLDPILGDMNQFFGEEYAQEVQGIANLTTSVGLDLGKLVLMNLLYELTEGCTSIVAQAHDGTIYHGRNLDYGIQGLQNITLTAEFQKNGATVYQGTVFMGYVGLLTGMQAEGFAITVNQRDEPHELKNLIDLILKGYKSIGLMLRTQLATSQNYSTAIGSIQRTPLAAPVYITVSGAASNQGMIISRNYDGPDDVWPLLAPEEYWRCQTNDDHWLPAQDTRRGTCNEEMKRYDVNTVNATSLLTTLNTPQVFNPTTIYTTLYHVASGKTYTMIRNL